MPFSHFVPTLCRFFSSDCVWFYQISEGIMGFTVKIDLNEFNRKMEEAKRTTSEFSNTLKIVPRESQNAAQSLTKLGNTAVTALKGFATAYVVTRINELRKELVQAGSDAEETANKFNVVFATVSERANQAADNLRLNYGLSREGAQAALSSVGDLLSGLGVASDKALELAQQTVQLGTDLASFTNYAGGAEGATQALTSALLGETEAAKSLGVVLTDDQMEKYASSVGKSWKNLNLAEKAQLRLNAAIAQSPNAVGDFARSMNSYANQVRIAEAISRDFTTTVGEGLLQAHTSALIAINGNRGAIEQLSTVISGFLASESDDLISFMDDVSDSGEKSSTEISILASSFIQASGGAKALWNGIQIAVDGIIALVDTVIVGKEQINLFGEALYRVMTFDFEGASSSLNKAGEIGKNWSKNIRESFSIDWNDMTKGLDMVSRPDALFKEYTKRVEKLRKDAAESARKTARSSGGGTGTNTTSTDSEKSKIESAKRALEGVRAEIEKMRGSGDDFGIDLVRKLDDIAKNAKTAGLSMSEMNALQNEYAQAATAQHYQKIADAIRDVDIQIANLNGDTAKARILEVNKQVEELTRRLTELGEAPDRVTKKAQELRAALNLQSQIKDAQAAADFYRELAQLSGNYGRSQEYVDQLLSLQADNLIRNVGITRELADEWLRLQKIQNSREAWAGAYRATQEYFSEATNLAQGFENLTTNAFSSMEDGIVRFTMTAKLSVKDMVNSITSDLVRMMARSSLTGPLAGALGSGLSNLFSDWSTNIKFNNLADSIVAGATPSAHGNILSGAGISSYSNSIVSEPTLFGFDRLTPFARGGIMGEAGPEAVMPLVRTSGGNLGVRAEGTGKQIVNVTVINNAGAQVETSQRENEDGSLDVEIVIDQMVTRSMVKRSGGASNVLRKGYGIGMIPISR
ncbi:lambda family phage tail tape measure protein [Bilophila wadsworthia 3_1_6]|uniref:Lambda family phage tail tape measure protein n=2 Tax=Bilophila wadsworthia TaxID=35833 RepID=E5Y9U5_BILW3|nr:lambda family phage tail tape measure protein [Bilophila wadsworthia 3_1_6]